MYETIQLHDLIWFLLVGGLAGWLASVLVNGGGLGFIGDIVVGVLGSFLGGFLATLFGVAIYGFWGVMAMAVLGAAILLLLVRTAFPNKRTYRN